MNDGDWRHSIERIAASRRIIVLGSSGSGKTWLALRLAQLLEIEPIHLDAHFWKPGWVSTPQPLWREMVFSLLQKPSWIIDGMYESTLDLRLAAADAIIVIERGRLACLWGVLARKMRGGVRPDAPPGQRIDRAFVKYIWRYPRVTRPTMLQRLRDLGAGKETVILNGRKDVNRFLRHLESYRRGQPENHTVRGSTSAAVS